MNRFAMRLAAAAGVIVSAAAGLSADYYVGDTGRTAKMDMPAMGPSDGGPMGGQVAGAETATTESAAVFQVDPKELHFPDLEKAIVQSGVDRIAVQSDGIATSLRTFAEIQINAITGRKSVGGQDPVYTILGMIYQNALWVRAPVIPVESSELAGVFGLDPNKHNKVSPVWVMKTPKARTLVMGALGGNDGLASSLSEDAQDALKKFSYRVGAFLNLPGEFKLVPLANSGNVWLAPSHFERPDSLRDEELVKVVTATDRTAQPYAAVLALDKTLRESYDNQAPGDIAGATRAAMSQLDGSADYLPAFRRTLDYWNTKVHPFKVASWLFFASFGIFVIYLTTARKSRSGDSADGSGSAYPDGRVEEYAPGARDYMGANLNPAPQANPVVAMIPELAKSLGAPAFAMSAGGMDIPVGSGSGIPAETEQTPFRTEGAYGDPILQAEDETSRGSRVAWRVAYAFMLAAAGTLIGALLIRAVLKGTMPVSNMYESITFAMGAFATVSVIFEGVYRRGWAGAGASLMGWALMTMANSMPLHSRKMEPLVAVLNSVWLNFHVTSLLISYSCFLLAFVFGLLYFTKELAGNRAGMLPRAAAFEYLTYRSIQIGWPLLTLGVFLGAVWANTAWGSFWSWDPKETWALITWLTYTIYLHLRINLGWVGRRAVIASMVGFIMVLITYFGVSYLPGLSGGLHSYAEPIKR